MVATPVLPLKDRLRMRRYEIERFWCRSIEEAPEIVDWSFSRMEERVIAYEWWHMDLELLKAKDVKAIRENHPMDHRRNYPRRRILEDVLQVLKFDGSDNGIVYKKGEGVMSDFVDYMQDGGIAERVQDDLKIRVDGGRIFSEPVQVAKDIINKTGLDFMKSKQVMVSGTRTYWTKIDSELLQIISEARIARTLK